MCLPVCGGVCRVQSLTDVLSGLTKSDLDGDLDRSSVDDQLTDLRLLTSYLENELKVVRQENTCDSLPSCVTFCIVSVVTGL